MLQRRQSFYLILAAISTLIMFFLPLAEFLIANEILIFHPNAISAGSEVILSTYPLTILLVTVIVVSLITIFLYKNRTLQMRLSRLNILLLIGNLILIAFYIYKLIVNENAIWNFNIACALPALAAYFTFLALRAIKKDEDLIKSIDRIR